MILTAGGGRLPRAPDLADADPGGAGVRRHHAGSAAAPGPAEGTKATTVTPGPGTWRGCWSRSTRVPVNIALLGKGNTVGAEALREQVAAGISGLQAARGLGLDARRDRRLPAGGRPDRRAGGDPHRHAQRGRLRRRTRSPRSPAGASTPTTPRARAAATRRTSSPSPGSRTCCRRRPTRPGRTPSTPSTSTSTCSWSATTSTRPCPRTWRSPSSRIRPSTIAAEDLLHDLGAISMIGSDSQAMGRVGEVPLRTWQTAHVGKKRWGALPGDGPADNLRARRYVAKYTICPADRARARRRGRLGRAGQARRPGAVGSRRSSACGRRW